MHRTFPRVSIIRDVCALPSFYLSPSPLWIGKRLLVHHYFM